MSDARRDSADGAPGHRQPIHASEQSRANAAPEPPGDSGTVEHATRTIPGATGPIEIVEDSGTAAPETGATP